MVITPEMSGNILLSVLPKGKGHVDHVHAELQQCRIEPPMLIEDIKWKEVIDLIQMDDYQLLVQQELVWSIKHWKDIKKMTPQLDKMIELLNFQQACFLEK